MALKYVSEFKTTFTSDRGEKFQLIWGEPCDVLGDAPGGMVAVRAWGMSGTMDPAHLGDEQLLELYVIDVAQGDGLLVHTPDDKWHLIDAGDLLAEQQLQKGAPNFIGWKFRKGLELDKVSFETVMFTHADQDHFGGLIDVLSEHFGDPDAGHPPLPLEVKNFYHPGIAKWKGEDELGHEESGTVTQAFPQQAQPGIEPDDEFITELLDGRPTFTPPPGREFKDNFGRLAALVATKPTGEVKRIDSSMGFLEGYETNGPGQVAIRILGPVLEEFRTEDGDTREGLRVLGKESITVNGHSIVLRLEYGEARLLLTGDLNDKSQRLLLTYHDRSEFAVDVAKGCHHGADEIDLGFTSAMGARATVISSGDNENYSHPRPFAVGASGFCGRMAIEATGSDIDKGRPLPPLVYSTELARSTKLQAARTVTVPGEASPDQKRDVPADQARVSVKKNEPLDFKETPLATGLIYGLVNIRTDGERILCAIHNEQRNSFDIEVFAANRSPKSPGE